MKRKLLVTLLLTVAISWGSLAAVLAAGWTPKLGLDLQGGFSVVLTVPQGTEVDPAVLEKAVEIMRRRIENLGNVQEPEISVQGNRSIQVQLPGVQDRERALQAVGTTGVLSFRPVLDILPVSPYDPILQTIEQSTTTTSSTSTEAPSEEEAEETTTTTTSTTTTTTTTLPPGIDPDTGLTAEDDPTQQAWLRGENGSVYLVAPAFLTGTDITGANALFGGGSFGGEWVVDPSFTGEGGAAFEAATAELSMFSVGDPRRQLAIVVDGVVTSAPQIAAEVLPGEALDADNVTISIGTADNPEAEARDLATILQYGALPATFERERVESVSASLGEDSLQAGLVAGLGGLILVGFALLLYYRALGIVAMVGLSIFGSLLLLSIILLGQFQGTTLTLAGVTGIIVSVGITSDSYIVFFERIKEEHRRGRPLRPSVDLGFEKAFQTILTADTVTFSGSILLWLLAIGPVKGFAITLGIATVIDVIVAYFFTRPAVMLLVRGRFGKGGAVTIEGAMGRPTKAAEASA